ncbi:hypothetical protein D1007_22011 [Hordeum vulgare]|nr:hypothetical protein D1007_22011 [Hordeum vulgare]
MSSAVIIRRARSRSSPGCFDSSRRTRPQVVQEAEGQRPVGREEKKGDAASALPDDMLLEVFRRLSPPTGAVCCGAVCRRCVLSRAATT